MKLNNGSSLLYIYRQLKPRWKSLIIRGLTGGRNYLMLQNQTEVNSQILNEI